MKKFIKTSLLTLIAIGTIALLAVIIFYGLCIGGVCSPIVASIAGYVVAGIIGVCVLSSGCLLFKHVKDKPTKAKAPKRVVNSY